MNSLPIALIPAYMPSKILPEITKSLMDSGAFQGVVCVDDGSGSEYSAIFNKLEELGVRVLRHSVNLGKGAAIRTGLNECLSLFPQSVGTVTLDADGQHLSVDAINVAKKLYDEKSAIILGTRVFDNTKTPLRSRFGNLLTKYVFTFMTGLSISDTQTGLRGIPALFIPKLLRLKTNGYDFELDMLILAKELAIPIKEITITTVYENDNATSHFNPVFDSLRIYFVFLRYAWVGFISFLIDFTMFMIFLHIASFPLIYANIAARAVSSTTNYALNRYVVFKSKNSIVKEYLKYFILMVYVLIINTSLVCLTYNYVTKFAAFVKISAEVITFLITFIVSRSFVFKDRLK